MKRNTSQSTIAGKRMRACPQCGAMVREDLLHNHTCRTHGHAQSPRQPPSPLSTPDRHQQPRQAEAPEYAVLKGRIRCRRCGLHVPAVHYPEHRSRCDARRTQAPVPQLPQADPEKPEARTRDGYPIDRCWDCGHRICLVPDEHGGAQVYEITHDRHCGAVHVCDGAKPESRRTRLTYVNTRTGKVAPARNTRGPRKL